MDGGKDGWIEAEGDSQGSKPRCLAELEKMQSSRAESVGGLAATEGRKRARPARQRGWWARTQFWLQFWLRANAWPRGSLDCARARARARARALAIWVLLWGGFNCKGAPRVERMGSVGARKPAVSPAPSSSCAAASQPRAHRRMRERPWFSNPPTTPCSAPRSQTVLQHHIDLLCSLSLCSLFLGSSAHPFGIRISRRIVPNSASTPNRPNSLIAPFPPIRHHSPTSKARHTFNPRALYKAYLLGRHPHSSNSPRSVDLACL